MANTVNPAQAGGISITPQDAEDALLIQSYGGGGFKLQDRRVKGHLYVDSSGFWPLEGVSLAELDLAPALERFKGHRPEILLIGTGAAMTLAPKSIRQTLGAAGIAFDTMDTGAAARTYNILLLEGRKAAALLLAVD